VTLGGTPETGPPAQAASSAWSGRVLSLLLILASMSVITARLADSPVMSSANDRSRWSTVWSLVERNTYQIDEIRQRPGWATIDQVRHQGHFYSSKPPLLPRLVAELYRGLKKVTGWTLTEQTALVTRTLLFLINVIPMGIALVFFSRLMERQATSLWAHLFVMSCACWGMLLLPFLTAFNNHTVAASCFFIVLPLSIDVICDQRTSGWRYFALGVLSAFGVCNELPAALFGVCLFLMLLVRDSKRTLGLYLPGALIVLAAFFITNYQVTGSLKPFYARYGTETYEFVFEGIPSYWKNPGGIDRPRDSMLVYLWHCTFGHHGIYSLSPIYLLTLLGWFWPRTYRGLRWKWFHLLGLFLTVVTLGFYLTKTANYNYGGVSVALRWMLWLTPFWLLSMVPVVNLLGTWKWFRGISLVLLSVSIFSAWYPATAPWTQNWLFQLMTQAGWIDYSDPPPKYQQTHYTWLGALPQGERQPDYSITFTAFSAEGLSETMAFQDGGPLPEGKRLIHFRRQTGTDPVRETGYIFQADRFRAGAPVQEFLIGKEDNTPLTETDFAFFRGMPRRMQYVSSRIRYEKTPLRTDAFRCHIGYTYVTLPADEAPKRRIVRNVWYSEEVPFGVLKWEEHVEVVANRERLAEQVWNAATVGKFLPRQETSPF